HPVVLVADAGRDPVSTELIGIAQHDAPVAGVVGDRARQNESLYRRTVPAHFVHARLVGSKVEDTDPVDVIELTRRPAEIEISVDKAQRSRGSRTDAPEVDGRDRAGHLIVAYGHAAELGVFYPEDHPPSSAEVAIVAFAGEGRCTVVARPPTRRRGIRLAVGIKLSDGSRARPLIVEHDLEA